jgi:hypothetical protein
VLKTLPYACRKCDYRLYDDWLATHHQLLTMTTPAIQTIKILYNDTCGDFNFSAAFLADYKARTGKELNERRDVGYMNRVRRDPIAIALVEENGAEWASAEYACIMVSQIPAVFERYWEIEDTYGEESVRVLISDALADLLDTFMQTGELETLREQYARIDAGRRWLRLDARYEEPVSLAPVPVPTIADPHDEDGIPLRSAAAAGGGSM